MSEPQLTDHAYDGIQEYDNPLPGWWKWLFIATILFCPFYWLYYHGGGEGRSVIDQYDVAIAENTRLQFAEMGEMEPDEKTILENMAQDNRVKVGRVVFKTHCISCHGRDGEGKVGANLTDDVYKNINNLEDIAKVIANGAAQGAMPAWDNRLHPNEIVLVSAFVASLRDTNVEGGRVPEGKKIPPFPEPIAPQKEQESESGAPDS